MKYIRGILATALFGGMITLAMPAGAQPAPDTAAPQPPAAAAPAQPYPDCGTWQSGTWVPSGACGASDYRSHVTGTITSIKGHLVTLQQSTQTIVINDEPALKGEDTGKMGVGRQVVAVGYWRSGTFYATGIHSVPPGGLGVPPAAGGS